MNLAAVHDFFLGLQASIVAALEKLDGGAFRADAWTRAADRRVVYAGLGPGRYTLEARVSGSDQSRSAPAIVSFRVLPPWYERWWFLTLVVSALLLGAYSAHRVQLAHALRTERLRSRIATDLGGDPSFSKAFRSASTWVTWAVRPALTARSYSFWSRLITSARNDSSLAP